MSEIQSDVQKKVWQRKSVQKKHAKAARVLAMDPQYREKVSAGVKAALADPDIKAKMSQRATAAWARRKAEHGKRYVATTE